MSEINPLPPVNPPEIQTELPTVPSQLMNGGTSEKPITESVLNTPENNMITTPESEGVKEFKTHSELVHHLKLQALGENPAPEKVEEFENSIQGLSLNVLERFYKLQEMQPPFEFVGNEKGDLRYGRTGLFVGSQYSINADIKGSELKKIQGPHISLQAPMSGGDDVLIHGLWGVDIDIQTGEMKSGAQEVTQEQKATLEAVLKTTQAYYSGVEKAIPLAESFKKAGGYAPNLAPPFPQEALQQLRRYSK